jgi:hypothetical protein
MADSEVCGAEGNKYIEKDDGDRVRVVAGRRSEGNLDISAKHKELEHLAGIYRDCG